MPLIETNRLLLRGWTEADAHPFADMMSDPRVMEFYARPFDWHAAYDGVSVMRQRFEENGYGRFVLEIKGRAGFAGMMVLDDIRYPVPFEPAREIGWLLPVEHWGNGYAPEAARALLDFARNTLHWPRIVAMTTAPNYRSQRVMQKLGMTHDPAENFMQASIMGCEPEAFVLYRKELL